MVGAGAVFLELARLKRFRSAIISDSNEQLMNAWMIVQSNVDELVKELRRPQYRYERSVYLQFRAMNPADLSSVEAAARFIYLNKTCFNGLYRVNADGQFNVPFGRYTDPVICDEPNLRAVSAALAGVQIKCMDACRAMDCFIGVPRRGDVNAVYVDPPYIPVSKTASFTSYTESGFGLEDHSRLVNSMTALAKAGFRVVTSNSAAPAAVELLKDFDVDHIVGGRSVAGGANDRKSVRELVAFAGPRL